MAFLLIHYFYKNTDISFLFTGCDSLNLNIYCIYPFLDVWHFILRFKKIVFKYSLSNVYYLSIFDR